MSTAQVTPNLGLAQPPIGTNNWGQSLNQNMMILDTAIGNLQSGYQGSWLSGTIYTKGETVTAPDSDGDGSLWISDVNNNQGNSPATSPLAWTSVSKDGESAYGVYVSTVPSGETPKSKSAWVASLVGATDSSNFINGVIAAVVLGSIPGTSPVVSGTSGGSVDNPVSAFPFLVDDPINTTGALESLSLTFNNPVAGHSVRILIANKTGANTFQVVDFFDVTLSTSAAFQTFAVGTAFTSRNVTQGQYRGYIANDGVFPAFDNSASAPGYWAITTGADVTSSTTWDVHNATGRLDFSMLIQPAGTSPDPTPGESLAPAVQVPIEALISSSLANYILSAANRTQLWSEIFAGTSLPAGWTAGSGAWTVNGGLISPSSGQGYGSYAYFARQYSLTKRTSRITFEVLSSGTILGFGSVENLQETANTILQSLIVVDGSANTISIANAGYNGTNPGTLQSSALGFSLATGKQYVLTVTINDREMAATLADPVTGTLASVSYGNNATDSAVNASTPAGILSEYPVFVAIAGQYKVHSFQALASGTKPRIIFEGDSITFGSYVTIAQRWANLVGSQVGPSARVSGRPGGTSYGVLARITSEVQYLRPDFLVLMIGTNDTFTNSTAVYEANLQAAITAAKGYGCQVIVCTLPTNANSTVQAKINTYNAFILGLSGVTVVRADLATSTGNDGVTQNVSLFQGDGTHPNASGGIAIANRFQVDAPFVFD